METQPTDIANRALDVAVHVVENFSPELANKAAKGRYGIVRNRSSLKRKEQCVSKHEATDLASAPVDITDAPRDAYQFLLRYKCLVESQNESKLKLLEVHLGKMISVTSGPLQLEIFKKLILGVFANSVKCFNKEMSLEPSSTQLVEKCLKFLPRFLIEDEMFQVFAQRGGVSYLETFARNDRLAPLAFEALHQISKRKSPRIVTSGDGKSVRIFKDPTPKPKAGVKGSSDLTLETNSSKAMEVLLSCGKRLLSNIEERPVASDECKESITWNSACWVNLLKLLDILNEMQMESSYFRERFSKEQWHRISFDILKRSLSFIKQSLSEKNDQSRACNDMLNNAIRLCLPSLRTVLPICLSFCVDGMVSVFYVRKNDLSFFMSATLSLCYFPCLCLVTPLSYYYAFPI